MVVWNSMPWDVFAHVLVTLTWHLILMAGHQLLKGISLIVIIFWSFNLVMNAGGAKWCARMGLGAVGKNLLFAYFRISVDSVVSDTSDALMDQWKLCAWRRLPRELQPTPVWNWLLVAAQRWEFNFRTVPQNQKFLARSFSVLCVCERVPSFNCFFLLGVPLQPVPKPAPTLCGQVAARAPLKKARRGCLVCLWPLSMIASALCWRNPQDAQAAWASLSSQVWEHQW